MNQSNGNRRSKGWDTEVFLLGASTRDELVHIASQLIEEAQSLADEHFSSFAESVFTGCSALPFRLGIVASDFDDLRNKLNRAVQKLSDGCEKIRDVSGIFFTGNPLGIDAEGNRTKVAYIFPGEGSQYLGMINGLAENFPHVREILDHCEELNETSIHRDKCTTRFFQDPSGFSKEELAEAEAELRRIDFAMFSVFIADWIMLSVLERLQVHCDAMAGHSAGELVALMASRVLSGSEEQFNNLREGFRKLGKDAPPNAVKSKLIALGTSAETAEKIIGEAAEEAGRELDSFVAMRNCPHQTVIVGTREDTELVEKIVTRRGLVYQQLELEQPYHTPLFEPYMGALREMFEEMDFHPAESTIYSCTSGDLFPKDPSQIAELTLDHWVSPVRFIELIENQYRDGVRCFIEVGPRNNLCSFTEDILRGKDVVVLPANLQRSDDITQINQLVAQLYVHHFAVDPSFLFQVRKSPGPESGWLESLSEMAGSRDQILLQGGDREQVMESHFQLMEEFLELQREVTEYYFENRGGEGISEVPVAMSQQTEPIHPPEYAMIDEIIECEPGLRIVARRSMDLGEDYFSDQHTVGGRELSRVNPEQHGLPVVPMTFSIEMVAEVAQTLLPHLQVIAMKEIKLMKWLDYDDQDLAFAQVVAEVNSEVSTAEMIIVEAKLFHWKGGEEPNFDRPASTAVLEMATAFPDAPPAGEYELENERPCTITREVLYKNLFHGEEYQGVDDFTRFGDEGIEATVHALPRTKLFRSNPEPRFVFDPVLLDVALHPMCAWHLEQEDQSGRILLPIGVDRIEFYGPCPEPGTPFFSRAKMRKETTRQFTQEVQLVDSEERSWCRMQGSHYWRFYLPFSEFNFHGPKDVYMLSKDWSAVLPNENCLVKLLDVPNDLRNPTMQPIGARVTLSDREFAEFQKLDFPDDRKTQWLFGKVAAKEAVKALWSQTTGERLFTADVEIEHDEFGRPLARMRGKDTPTDFPAISLSHSGSKIVAIASSHPNTGIDIEKITQRESGFLKIAFSRTELSLLAEIDPEMTEWVTRFWCAKEAVGKALGRGLIDGPRGVEIFHVEVESGILRVHLLNSMLEAFPEFAEKAITVQTSIEKKLAVASTVCQTVSLTQFEKATNPI